MNTIKFWLLIAISIFWLSACGHDDDDDDDTYVEPPPPMASFPTQVEKPTSMVVNDNGSLVLAASGLSLYTFDNDTMDTSTCEGTVDDLESCAGKWPPLLAGSGAQANDVFTIITRTGGDNQWAMYGQPLYHYYEDVSQGDILGDGLGGIWHLARRMPVAVTTINQLPTYVGFETILTVSDSDGVLTSMRADKHDFTLYTFDPDPLDGSVCSGDCINFWPPLLADAGATAMPPLSIVDVGNGNMQWSFKGKPLYFFLNDINAGDVNGDEVNDVWHTATLEPAIQRTTDNGRSLSATGLVNVLMSVGGEATAMDKDGFSLYTFDPDGDEMSNCLDENDCLANWPAFVPDEGEMDIGDFTRFTRANGTDQWAYKGMPLYFFIGDMNRGEINGDGLGGVWHLIFPEISPDIDTIQQRVFTPKCSGCHGGATPAAGMDLSSVEQSLASLVNVDANNMLFKRVLPSDAMQSYLYLKVTGDPQAGERMPFMQDPLPNEEIQAIKEWIEMMAPVEPPPPVNPNANITWIQDNVFTPICSGCHNNGPTPQGMMNLSSVAESLANLVDVDAVGNAQFKRVLPMDSAQSYLYLKVTGDSQAGAQMPFGGPPLSAEQMQAIKEWIDMGAMP
ncbi:hypothetical protein [Thalassotalea sp. ND16A]|uniref:hypothetical protein n=1 Tax=Thalassotalea sp. ND16A TaxID=1535422 RepID=UPI00051A6981|nr:hypothetical protein [Thalassotalea sp. ND16A]KGJ95699.1 hypothetical protein ND16A_1234 [Thalassotalea sp. ND16A]